MELAGKRIAYVTLGCKLNFSETSTTRHRLEQAGATTVDERGEADIFVVNTCSVTDIAEKKGRQLIRRIAHRNPGALIVVMGCYAQLRAREIMAIEGVGLVLDTRDKPRVVEILRQAEEGKPLERELGDVSRLTDFDLAYSYGDRTRCFLKIQDGCDYFCSYCTIPFARGRSRSATIAQAVEAARDAARRGIREIILTGVNTGDFGRGRGETFLDLLRTLDGLEEVDRFRVSSIEPNLLTDDIIRFVSESRRFMPHFHVPLQSGSDEVLRLMRRRYGRELFAGKVARIRSLLPDAFIGVDVIAGMRGETEAAFEDGLRFVESLDVSRLHVFPYSERAGTRALDIPLAVPQAEKHRRVEALLRVSERKLRGFLARHRGEVRPVLFEDDETDGMIGGFTDNYIRVEVPYDRSLANRVVPTRLGAMNENGNVTGEITD